jgi:hypothetical protein
MTDQTRPDDELDPGAYIGHEPEREAETIPGGVSPQDERTSAYDSRPGIAGEPDTSDAAARAGFDEPVLSELEQMPRIAR